MLSLNDIINVGFRKSGFSGYRADDVEAFVDKVKTSYEELLKQSSGQAELIEKLKAENQQNVEKLKILASKIEEYRSEEDDIKNALISAQKLSEASVREARHKAEIIVKDADLKAEHIVSDADRQITEKKRELEELQKQVSDFRSRIMGLYKEHLTLISSLPVFHPQQAEPKPQPEKGPAPQPAAAAPLKEQPSAAKPAPEAESGEEPGFTAQVSNFDE